MGRIGESMEQMNRRLAIVRAKKPFVANLKWMDAVKTAEMYGNTGPLAALLRSEKLEPPKGASVLLSALLERRNLTRKNGAAEREYTAAPAEWVDVVKAAETIGDSNSLIALLRSKGNQMSREVRNPLADLFAGCELTRKKGGQRTPIFAMSAAQTYAAASDHVDDVMGGREMFIIARQISMGREIVPMIDCSTGIGIIAISNFEPLTVYVENKKLLVSGRWEFGRRETMISEERAITYVAAQWKINGKEMSPAKLKNFRNDKIGFRRKAKPRPIRH
jgi:hypothetical protein